MAALSLVALRGSSYLHVERPYGAPGSKEVLAVLKARAARVNAIRGETRMSHRTEQGRIKATVRLMAARGGKLRFDAVTPFDTPLSTLVTRDGRFALVDARKNRHYHGPASPCNIARLIQVSLEPDDVLTVLAGSTPVIAHDSAMLAWDGRASEEVLTLGGSGLTQTIRLDGSNRRWDLLSSEIRDDRGVVLAIRASGHRRVGGLRLPKRIQVSQPRNDARLDATFKQQEANVKLPAAAFELPGPRGMPSQKLECTTETKP